MILKSPDFPNASPPAACLDIALGLDMVGDEQSLQELLDMAEQALTRDIRAVAEHLEQGNAKGANGLLHAIKGFAPIFCAEHLVRQITGVELLSKTAAAQEIAVHYAELAPALAQLRDEICVYLGRTPSAGSAP